MARTLYDPSNRNHSLSCTRTKCAVKATRAAHDRAWKR